MPHNDPQPRETWEAKGGELDIVVITARDLEPTMVDFRIIDTGNTGYLDLDDFLWEFRFVSAPEE